MTDYATSARAYSDQVLTGLGASDMHDRLDEQGIAFMRGMLMLAYCAGAADAEIHVVRRKVGR